MQMENLQWYPGHMAKTRRMIEENLKNIDVVVEILDARIPFSGRNPNFDDIISAKPRLVVMNKYDLADSAVTDKWISWYESRGIRVLPISCATGMGINKIVPIAREMIKEKIERAKAGGRAVDVKMMMVGIPNVGKSTLINRLAGKAKAETGDRPGVTRTKQWIRLPAGPELLDTPGILPPKFENGQVAVNLAYTGAIRDEIMEVELLAYSLLDYLRDHYADLLCARYKLDAISQLAGHEILELIGRKRGCIISGGEIDTERAANILLDELRGCKIGKITLEDPQ